MPSIDLTGKVAVVTGSGRGLGLAYAHALAAHGASVVVNDIDEAVAEQAVKSITEAGGTAVAEVVPVGTTEAAERLVNRAVEEFGRLDILVTNAGILRDKVLWKMTDDDFDAVITTHLKGTFTCARAAAVRMREQGEGGSLILVGSPAGQRGNFGQTNYAAAKAGIAAMARTWSMELGRAGITVNAIVPVAATAMTETIPAFAPYVEAMKNGEPLPDVLRKGEGFGTPRTARHSYRSWPPRRRAGSPVRPSASAATRWHSGPTRRRSARPTPTAAGPPTPWPTPSPPRSAPNSSRSASPHRSSRRRDDTPMDLDGLVAIDVHTHAEVSSKGHSSLDDDLHDASSAYFKVEGKRKPTLEETAAYYRERNMAAVIFTVDAESATGTEPVPNEEVAEAAAANADVLIPFASIDPFRGKAGVRQARRLVEEYGVKGFKFHPNIQGFFPNDRAVAYDLYEVIQETGTIALFHTGQTGIGAGVPGGGGIRLKYSNPCMWTTSPPTSRT